MKPINVPEPGRLSFSSVRTYTECGERWRFERLYGVNESTWFATVGGSVVHEITEQYDRGLVEVVDAATFKDVFDAMLADVEHLEVKPSGKVLKSNGPNGGPHKKDYDWWLEFGPQMVDAWRSWRARTDWELVTLPGGEPAIEVPLECNVGGDTFRGYIDRVFRRPDGEYVVVDIKTGADSGLLQLGTYRVGLKRQYGIDASLGGFWSPFKDDVWTYDLSVFSDSYVDAQFEMAWRGIRAGVFLANPGSLCNACDAKPFCRAAGGQHIGVYPVRTNVIPQHVSLDPVVPGV